MDNLSIVFKALLLITAVSANLEGPFLFWGPDVLKEFKRSALQTLDQDDLIKIYERQSAVVVFNNQDSVPLSGTNFPRLRKLLETKPLLVLPQDFLDVHPDYVNNETQVFALQGPHSERDAEITETFNRLEDIFGRGRVLAVLGNSMSSEVNSRERRGADESNSETTKEVPKDTSADKSERAPVEYALYNASTNTVSTTPQKVLVYSSRWPALRLPSGEDVALKRYLTATVDVKPSRPDKDGKDKKTVTKMILKFAYGNNNKISLHLRYTTQNGWWQSGPVEVHFPPGGSNATSLSPLLLQPPAGVRAPAAVLRMSFHCSHPVVYTGSNASLTFYDLQMQPFMEEAIKFSDSFDCTGFTTEPIWSGTLLSVFLSAVLFAAMTMVLDIRTNDRYENSKSKALVITVAE